MCVAVAPFPHHLGESMPSKAYKRTPGRSVGMPQDMTAQNFNRRISAEEALILATAGDGITFGARGDVERMVYCSMV